MLAQKSSFFKKHVDLFKLLLMKGKIIPIKGDEDCLFHTVLYFIYDKNDGPFEMRLEMVTKISDCLIRILLWIYFTEE